jgi:uncharacterized ubiquitin-like protein YukD
LSNPKRLRKKSKLKVFTDACNLVEYVLTITSNAKVFKPKQKVVTDKIKSVTLDIARFVWCANNIRVRRDAQLYAERRRLQDMAVTCCRELLFLIDLSWDVMHLSERRAVYWIGMVVDLRDGIVAWRASDARRYERL